MLVRTHDGGVDHHVFVVVVTRQQLEKALENPALRPPAETLVDDLPITKAFRQIAPGNAGAIAIQNGFDEQPIIRRRAADVAFCRAENP